MKPSRAALVAVVSIAVVGCDVNTALERLSEARRLAADLHVRFTKAADAGNKAVMAETDEASAAFAQEAERAKRAVQQDADTLAPLLRDLGYVEEARLLEEFTTRFATYRELDRSILDLAVENTNAKAQRLSFAAAQQAADSFATSLEAAVPLVAARDTWRVRALVATAVASVREIQALQAPHIADADDTTMTRIEERMNAAEAATRRALEMLSPLIPSGSRPPLAPAVATLDEFLALNAQIVTLSRRNTDVRSLALSLNQKQTAMAACEDSLRRLRDALAARGFTGTR